MLPRNLYSSDRGLGSRSSHERISYKKRSRVARQEGKVNDITTMGIK